MIIDGSSCAYEVAPGVEPVQNWRDLEARGRAMEACPEYLLLVADSEVRGDLVAKGGVSDLIQETYLEATRDFERFNGRTVGDLRGSLRRILLNNLANFARRHRRTEKRRLSLKVSLDGGSRVARLREGLVNQTATPSNHAILNGPGQIRATQPMAACSLRRAGLGCERRSRFDRSGRRSPRAGAAHSTKAHTDGLVFSSLI